MRKPLMTAALMLVVPTLAVLPRVQMPHGTAPLYVPMKAAKAQDAAPANADLAQKAYAILEKNCTSCHGNGKRLSKGAAIDKDTWHKLVNEQKKITPGRPEESPVYTLMIDHENPMPPKKATQRPSAEEIEVVKQWIASGAPNWVVGTLVPATQPATPVVVPEPVVARTPVPTKPAPAKPMVRKPVKVVKPAAKRPSKPTSAKKSTKKPLKAKRPAKAAVKKAVR